MRRKLDRGVSSRVVAARTLGLRYSTDRGLPPPPTPAARAAQQPPVTVDHLTAMYTSVDLKHGIMIA